MPGKYFSPLYRIYFFADGWPSQFFIQTTFTFVNVNQMKKLSGGVECIFLDLGIRFQSSSCILHYYNNAILQQMLQGIPQLKSGVYQPCLALGDQFYLKSFKLESIS